MAGGEKFRYSLRGRLESESRRGAKPVSMVYACRDHGDLEVRQGKMEPPIGDRYSTCGFVRCSQVASILQPVAGPGTRCADDEVERGIPVGAGHGQVGDRI